MPPGELDHLTADAVGMLPATRALGWSSGRGVGRGSIFGRRMMWNGTLPGSTVPGLPAALAGIRIAHITDLHMRPAWRPGHDRLLEHLKQEQPDLLLVTGDFVDNKLDPRPALPFLYRLLEGFTARLGCFGILGNHDTYAMAPRLQGTNVRLITGKRELVPVHDATIELIGLEGVKRKQLKRRFVDSMPPRPSNSVRIVLSHFPDHLKRTKSLRPDLFLAGHTHGGQVCFPGGFPRPRHDTLPRRLCTGVHQVDGTWLVVSRGIRRHRFADPGVLPAGSHGDQADVSGQWSIVTITQRAPGSEVADITGRWRKSAALRAPLAPLRWSKVNRLKILESSSISPIAPLAPLQYDLYIHRVPVPRRGAKNTQI